MVRFFSVTFILFSISVQAQSVNIHAGPGGVSIDVREEAHVHHPPPVVIHQAPPPVVIHHAPPPVVVHQPPPQQVVVHQPPPPPVELGMPAAEFRALKQAIESESFEKQQLNVLQSAARRAQFTVEQVGQLIDLFSFSSGKVKVVEITRPRIVDRENLYQLYSHFTFDSDKDKVKHLLK